MNYCVRLLAWQVLIFNIFEASSFYDGFYGEDDTTLKMQDKVEEIFSDEFLTRGLYDED
jgi:hypothetical protein